MLENPLLSGFAASSMPGGGSWIAAADADCGLLLDVNNVNVSAYNHGFDPTVYIDAVPADRWCSTTSPVTNQGTHIIDTHSDHALDAVWELYRRA